MEGGKKRSTITHRPEKVTFKTSPIKKWNYELIAAIGKIANVKRKNVVFDACFPPKMLARSRDNIYTEDKAEGPLCNNSG